MEGNFHGRLIGSVRDQFEQCLLSTQCNGVRSEISCPDWFGLKTSFIDAVTTHNLNIYSTGLLREIYLEYMKYVFKTGIDEIHYYDDLPKYGYKMLTPFFPVWQIFAGLGYVEEESE